MKRPAWSYSWHMKYLLNKRRENFLHWFVTKLPKRLVYFCAIHVGVNATTGEYSNQIVPDLLFMDALKRWDDE